MMKYCLFALLTLISPSLLAAAAVVEGVQMPAWVEQEGIKTPLTPGDTLQNSDIVTTGEGGRAQLKLLEGSTLKLGENAHMTLDNLAPPRGADHSFRIAIAVNQGAFRLTSTTINKKTVVIKKLKKGSKKITRRQVVETHPRIISVQIGSIHTSANGGDFWGKANKERDVVALFRGKVLVVHDDATQTTLTRNNTYVDALSGGSLNPTRNAIDSDIEEWTSDTELSAGNGVASKKGPWKVNVATFDDGADAEALKRKIADEGYAVELASTHVSGRTQTRVQVPHFKTSDDAQETAERIRKEFDLDAVTVIR